jgi:hypothetical protein
MLFTVLVESQRPHSTRDLSLPNFFLSELEGIEGIVGLDAPIAKFAIVDAFKDQTSMLGLCLNE